MPRPNAHAARQFPACPLRFPIPANPLERLTLRVIRRMGAHGLRDASAALWMIEVFGLQFRRPLVLLRAFVMELSRGSQRRITIAPCCAPRMTEDEARIIAALRRARLEEPRAARHLSRVMGGGEVAGPLCAASAFSWALSDLGRPLPAPRTVVG